MAWRQTPLGEVDENGYFRWAVEAWERHGIYPPPIVGDPKDLRVVALVKESRARLVQRSPEERERYFQAERRFKDEFLAAFSPHTRASSNL